MITPGDTVIVALNRGDAAQTAVNPFAETTSTRSPARPFMPRADSAPVGADPDQQR
jgi:hypothetical protein